MTHNHKNQAIMPRGQCPRCDEVHHMRIPKMTTSEKLQAKIRSNADKEYLTDKELIPTFIHGANLLVPLLLEMVDVLEKYRNVAGYDQRHSVTKFSEAEVMLNKFQEFLK